MDRVFHVPLPNPTVKRSGNLQHTLKTPSWSFSCHTRRRNGGASGNTARHQLGVVPVYLVERCRQISPGHPGFLGTCRHLDSHPVAQTPLRTDSRRSIAHFLVSGWAICISPHPCGRSLWNPAFGTWQRSDDFSTLSIVQVTTSPESDSNGNPCLHAVGQPHSDGQSPLPGVKIELKHIEAVIQTRHQHHAPLESSLGTVEEVLDPVNKADWVHFACHGIQDADNPTESRLCLAARCRLKLSDIIASSRPRGGPAFFVCVQTATGGDKDLSDAAIHNAAGMLLAEDRGVGGTMWSSSDWLPPRVANLDVYEHLFRSDTRPDYRSRYMRD
ncbi:hypothetical protein JVT61DRAFT_2602 [Boletus reticuloceps]|uniref:CHAT domain-containing protein n=1 Tax=Boletus reticuloceps TaxID=495285 RepID=A0A8I3AA02_9AGAM|nr:hypothetical protein JVT61DRAFT_2602 [Boletus reticuloceps]